MIYNPFAGALQRNPREMDRAVRILKERLGPLELRPTYGPGSATAIAAESIRSGAGRILVAGGDGTINEAANGMVGSGVPLGILPGGTANVLAVEMKVGCNLVRAARGVCAWRPVPISTGVYRQNGRAPRHFLLMAGAGLDASIVKAVDPALKRRLGKLAYWIGGFSSLGKELAEFDVCFDGRQVRASYALASRVRNYGGDLTIARQADLLGDEFALVIFEGQDTYPYLKYFSGVLFNRLEHLRGVTVARTRSVQVRPTNGKPVDLQLDGELIGEGSATLEIARNSILLLVPPEFAAARAA